MISFKKKKKLDLGCKFSTSGERESQYATPEYWCSKKKKENLYR